MRARIAGGQIRFVNALYQGFLLYGSSQEWTGCHPEGPGLENCARGNFTRFNKTKYKVLHLGLGNPQYQYRPGDEQIENSPSEKDLVVLVDERLDVTGQCALSDQKASCILDCIKSSVANRPREGTLSLYSALVRSHLECCIQLWSPQHRNYTDLLECIQNAMKMIRSLEHLFCEDKLKELW
ncbi:hypothetical protein WISP_69166 [Willisornis vidua]|uniref:Uncharacterized protein n=1 Tax=Willisornis vidua TaxID=1566151 RepID=A0ABQ9DD87_9PASS|nr:hypothetical protein WISP_69166 [Willisornis vidua]